MGHKKERIMNFIMFVNTIATLHCPFTLCLVKCIVELAKEVVGNNIDALVESNAVIRHQNFSAVCSRDAMN